jgi:hypothetical protein
MQWLRPREWWWLGETVQGGRVLGEKSPKGKKYGGKESQRENIQRGKCPGGGGFPGEQVRGESVQGESVLIRICIEGFRGSPCRWSNLGRRRAISPLWPLGQILVQLNSLWKTRDVVGHRPGKVLLFHSWTQEMIRQAMSVIVQAKFHCSTPQHAG